MQDRFPLVREPFRELAVRAGVDERTVIDRLAAMRASGVLRQVSPIFDTKALGYESSLVAMRVVDPPAARAFSSRDHENGAQAPSPASVAQPPAAVADRLARAAAAVNAHPGVSHNYRRTHDFNLWFTIAVPPGADLHAHVDALHRLAGAESTRMLPTLRLFKIGVTLDMTGERAIDHRSAPQYSHEMREVAAQHQLTPRDIDVIRAVQGDLALGRDPFAAPARALGVTVEHLIEELHDLQRRGYLRRFAAILRHRKAGFRANGMAVWDVPDDRILDIGATMAGYTSISHCYQRPRYDDWPYNLFTMIHARRKDDVDAFVADLAERHHLDRYAVLYSTTEYKKTRLEYFAPAFDEWENHHLQDGTQAPPPAAMENERTVAAEL
jgi:DNA-binding Lrp family transcriptional regulator